MGMNPGMNMGGMGGINMNPNMRAGMWWKL
jgi:hypothetical protein